MYTPPAIEQSPTRQSRRISSSLIDGTKVNMLEQAINTADFCAKFLMQDWPNVAEQRDDFMEHSMEITDGHANIGDSSSSEEKRQHTDGLFHAGSFECERNLRGHHPGAEGLKMLLCPAPSRPPRIIEEIKALSEGTFSTAQSDNESIFSAPFGALSIACSSYSYDHENECQYTLQKGQLLGENVTLLENVLDTLPINHPIHFGEDHVTLNPGDLAQGHPSPVCHYCNERLVSGVCSGKGAKGAVIFADGQIPGHNEFVKDPVHAYWTWSSEEGNWWHQDEGTDTVVWAPLDFD